MPRFAAMSVVKELSLRRLARLRLQMKCVSSTRCGDQLCESPRFTLWPNVDWFPPMPGKLLSWFARSGVYVVRAVQIDLGIDGMQDVNVHDVAVRRRGRLQQEVLHRARLVRLGNEASSPCAALLIGTCCALPLAQFVSATVGKGTAGELNG